MSKSRSRSPSSLSNYDPDSAQPRPRAALYALLITLSFLIITYNLFSIPFSFSVSKMRPSTLSSTTSAIPSPSHA
ncbi:hypothetical protein EX30DRAFT_340441 [Ascodesmis nigricans]|uniref:Uncharacterized protein n=1 Tax=Ascodesmis nigricans TaxID=341454 RepID=A0A4S2MXX1_9PEZI|nr:hypothetical protein EX30DRAFT_340441 [Ascodesmis nigricans]